jgi:hypothetical protein
MEWRARQALAGASGNLIGGQKLPRARSWTHPSGATPSAAESISLRTTTHTQRERKRRDIDLEAGRRRRRRRPPGRRTGRLLQRRVAPPDRSRQPLASDNLVTNKLACGSRDHSRGSRASARRPAGGAGPKLAHVFLIWPSGRERREAPRGRPRWGWPVGGPADSSGMGRAAERAHHGQQ